LRVKKGWNYITAVHGSHTQLLSSQIFLSHDLVGKQYLDKIDISESSVNPH